MTVSEPIFSTLLIAWFLRSFKLCLRFFLSRFRFCFYGTSQPYLTIPTIRDLRRVVSISVFVELAFWNEAATYRKSRIVASILVFLKLALGRHYYRVTQTHCTWFQSLFSWKSPSDRGFFCPFWCFSVLNRSFWTLLRARMEFIRRLINSFRKVDLR